jgi:four helix bundle protein
MQSAECKMQNEDRRKADLRVRTKQYALRIVRLFASLKQSEAARVLGRQLLRSGTSVGAQYREACRARSIAEFVSKMEGALQELDETQYWIELLIESNNVPARRLVPLMEETKELLAIFITSIKTSKTRRNA